jgi:formiminotetrahydrofolate cyclodeaminase
MLADKTVKDLLDAFASPAPTPGGGSASALAAMSAALLEMVAAMPKPRAARRRIAPRSIGFIRNWRPCGRKW